MLWQHDGQLLANAARCSGPGCSEDLSGEPDCTERRLQLSHEVATKHGYGHEQFDRNRHRRRWIGRSVEWRGRGNFERLR
jgi:hypothetical protein